MASKTTVVYFPDTTRHRIIPRQTGLEPTPILLPRLGVTVLPAVRSDMEPSSNPARDFPYGYVQMHDGERKCLAGIQVKNRENPGDGLPERMQSVCRNLDATDDATRAEIALLMEHAQIARKVKDGNPSPGQRAEAERFQRETCKVWGDPGSLYREHWHIEGQRIKQIELDQKAAPVGLAAEGRKIPTLERCEEVEALIRSGETRPNHMPGRAPPDIPDSQVRSEMCIWLIANGWNLESYEEAKKKLTLQEASPADPEPA